MSAINNYAWKTNINWDSPGQTGIYSDTDIEKHQLAQGIREDFLEKGTLELGSGRCVEVNQLFGPPLHVI